MTTPMSKGGCVVSPSVLFVMATVAEERVTTISLGPCFGWVESFFSQQWDVKPELHKIVRNNAAHDPKIQ